MKKNLCGYILFVFNKCHIIKWKIFIYAIAYLVLISIHFSCNQSSTIVDIIAPKHIDLVSLKDIKMIAENINLDNENIYYQPQLPNIALRKENKLNTISEILHFDSEAIPALYVINFKGKGFVVFAADRKEVPILAYSNENHIIINATTTGVQEWIDWRVLKIKEIRKNGKNPDSVAISDMWKYLTTTFVGAANTRIEAAFGCGTPGSTPAAPLRVLSNQQMPVTTTKGPLLKTKWGQGCGYNDFCPQVGGPCGRAFTGCVATAMAQIMYYYKKPASYNWSVMPLNQGVTETSRLMRDAGNSVNTYYSSTGSSASTKDARKAMVETFKYQTSATYIPFDQQKIKQNISNGQPVILRGDNGSNNGHAWVCDGYSSTQYCNYGTLMLSMNWGWDGNNDGWYLFNDWKPANNNYNYNPYMIADLKP